MRWRWISGSVIAIVAACLTLLLGHCPLEPST